MELERHVLRGEILHPDREFAATPTTVEVRVDPLTGHAARLLSGKGLMPPNEYDLAALAEATRTTCPFCSERLEARTPRLSPAIWPEPEGRIRVGEAVLFPNLTAYAKWSVVSVFSPYRHLLPLGEMTPRLVADNLAAQVAFHRAVVERDPDAPWASVNANHMLPSGSSLFHPHLQGSADTVPTTMQRMLAEVPGERFRDYVETERRAGERYLGSTGGVTWLASFAPIGPNEVRAVAFGSPTPAALSGDLVEELGAGIATVLNLYAELGFESYNLAAYGGPPGRGDHPLNLRIVCRSNLREPAYRSDAAWMERLHWDAGIDLTPEELAERAHGRFG